MIKSRHIVIMLLLFGMVQSVSAQEDMHKADSLKKVLEGKQGKERMEVLEALIVTYWSADRVQRLKYVKEQYELARVAPVDSFLFVRTGRWMATTLDFFERYDEALTILDEIISVARRQNYERELFLSLGTGGTTYSTMGKHDMALSYQMESLKMREKAKSRSADAHDIAIAQGNIGLEYYRIYNYQKALQYYFLSLKSKQSINDDYDVDLVYSNIALCYLHLYEYRQGLAYAYKGLRLCEDNCEPYVRMNITLTLGMLYHELDRLDSAKIFLTQSYNTAVSENNYRYKAESLVMLAREANDEAKSPEALRYAIESEKNALQSYSFNMIKQAYYQLFRAKRGTGDYEGAAACWDKYLAYRDSLFNESMNLSLVSMHIDFEQKQNEARLALQESTVQWQGRRNSWIAVLGGLLFIAVGVLIFDYISRKRENETLEAQVRDRTRALENKIRTLERQETERRTWEEKIDKSVREGNVRIDALGEMVTHSRIKTALRNWNGGRESDHLKIPVEK